MGPLASLIEFLYPPACALCGDRLVEGEAVACDECRELLLPPFDWRCGRCGGTGSGPAPDETRACPLCPEPDRHYRGVLFACDWAGNEAARRAVHRFKYERRLELGDLMSEIVARRLKEPVLALGGRVEAIVPVPLFWARRLRRGFNQSERLAEALGEATGLPVTRSLRRRRHTRPQARLSPERRAENVRGAFALARGAEPPEGRGVLLVDDVVTTAHTIEECAKVLVAEGATEVWAACFARSW